MKKATSAVLSTIILILTLTVVVSVSGSLGYAEEYTEEHPIPTLPTTTLPPSLPSSTLPPSSSLSTSRPTTSTTTRFNWSNIFSSSTRPASSTTESSTSSTTKPTTKPTTEPKSEDHSEDHSETTKKPTTTKPTTTKPTTTKKPKPTIRPVPMPEIPNTDNGSTINYADAWVSRSLAEQETETSSEPESSTTESAALNNEDDDLGTGAIVMIFVCGALLATCFLAMVFSVRNKRLNKAESRAALDKSAGIPVSRSGSAVYSESGAESMPEPELVQRSLGIELNEVLDDSEIDFHPGVKPIGDTGA